MHIMDLVLIDLNNFAREIEQSESVKKRHFFPFYLTKMFAENPQNQDV